MQQERYGQKLMVFTKSGVLREKRWGRTRLKLRMQTHGFLGGNKCKAFDNVVEGKVKLKGEMVVKRGMEGTMVTRSAHYEENFPFQFKLSLLG